MLDRLGRSWPNGGWARTDPDPSNGRLAGCDCSPAARVFLPALDKGCAQADKVGGKRGSSSMMSSTRLEYLVGGAIAILFGAALALALGFVVWLVLLDPN